MTLQILTIPDDPAAWAEWLEVQLVSPHFADLIQELHLSLTGTVAGQPVAMNVDALPDNRNTSDHGCLSDAAELRAAGAGNIDGDAATGPAQTAATGTLLRDILDEQQLSKVLNQGLRELSFVQIQSFLSSPTALLELQEAILLGDGGYWDKFMQANATADDQRALSQVWQQISSTLSQPEEASADTQTGTIAAATATPATDVVSPAASAQQTKSRGLRWQSAVAVISAAVLLAMAFWPEVGQQPSGRILGSPGLLVADMPSSQAYFQRLAAAGNKWFDVQIQDSEQLTQLLQEVSHDCQILIDAEHPQLAAEERDWFVQKCQNWKNKLDEVRVALTSQQMSFSAAEEQADAIMLKLVNVLNAGPTV